MAVRIPPAVLVIVALSAVFQGCSKKPDYDPGCYMESSIHAGDRTKILKSVERFFGLLRSGSYSTAFDEASPQLKARFPRDQIEPVWASIAETLTIPAELTLDDMVLIAVQEGARGPQSVPCVVVGDSLAGRTMSATDQPFQAYLVHSGTVGANTYTFGSVWFFEESSWRLATFGAKPKLQGGRAWTWYRDLALEQRDKGNNRNAALLLNMAMELLIPAPWIRPDEVKRMETVQQNITVYELPLGRPLSWIASDGTEFNPYLVTAEVSDGGLGLRFAYEVDVPPDTARVEADAPKLARFIQVSFPEYAEIFTDLTLEAYTRQDHQPVWRSAFSLKRVPDRVKIAYLSIGRHIHTERWLRFFVDKGYEVHLLTVQPGPIDGVTVHDIRSAGGSKPLRYARSLFKVRAILRKLKPDLLHTHFLTGYGYWGVFSGYRPFMLTVWGDDVYVTPFESRIKNLLARHVLGKADFVTGDSVDIVKACVALGSDPERSAVVQWGVDFRQFHPGAQGPVREKLGISARAPVVLSTRSFTQAYYNIDVIIDSIPEVQLRFPEVIYIIAGNEGSDEEVRRRARKQGVEAACRFVGRIPHAELPMYLTTSDVYVTVPSVDATAVSLLEAMATGTAIVASDLPSAAEWIFEGESGRLVKPKDLQGLSLAIRSLLADPEARAAFGRRAVEIVREKADHHRNMEVVDGLYRRLIREHRARRSG